MKRREMIAWAVERYGRTSPSPDDILMARWPLYDVGDRIHVVGYHRDYEAVMARKPEVPVDRTCAVCGGTFDANATPSHSRKYCSRDCITAAGKDRRQPAKNTARPLTDAERQQIIELYLDGRSENVISSDVGRSHSTIHRVLTAAGITRNRGGRAA